MQITCLKWAAAVLVLLTSSQVFAEVNQKRGGAIAFEHNDVPLYGYIGDPEISNMAKEITEEFLANTNEKRLIAEALYAYIAPGIVAENRFVKPDGFEMSETQLNFLGGTSYPNSGCKVERVSSTDQDVIGEYMVLIVDATDHQSLEYIETCLLLAAATAMGVDMDGQPVMGNSELRSFLSSVAGN